MKWGAVCMSALVLIAAFIVKDYVRTLTALRRVPGSNAYVMDYYIDYHLDEIRAHGVDVDDLEGSFIAALLPGFAEPIAHRVKRAYVPKRIEPLESPGEMHRCSTVAMKTPQGRVLFGRNLDNCNDAYLILRVHDGHRLSGSIGLTDIRDVARRMSVDNWTMWTSVYDLTSRQTRVLYKARLDSEYCDAIDN
jgi:hypothetical protein